MASDVCNMFSSSLTEKRERERERTVWEIDLCGEAGEACNTFILSGNKKKKTTTKAKRN